MAYTSSRMCFRSAATGPLYGCMLKNPRISVSTASMNSASVGTRPFFSTFFRHSGFSVTLPPVYVAHRRLNWPFTSRNFRSTGLACAFRGSAVWNPMPRCSMMVGGRLASASAFFLRCPRPPTSQAQKSLPLSVRIFSGMPRSRMPRRSARSTEYALGVSVTCHPVKMPLRASMNAVKYSRCSFPSAPSVFTSKVWLSATHHSLLLMGL